MTPVVTPFNERTALLLGEDAVARLAASRVAVVGIGVWVLMQWRCLPAPVWAG